MTDYSNMPTDSRVWVYQSSRMLTDSEIDLLNRKAAEFISSWTAHDSLLKACFEIRNGIFFILMVDEKQAIASGCSIDKSVHFVLQLERDLGVSFTNRMLFAYRDKNGEISLVNKNVFEQSVHAGIISDDTIVFNTLVSNKTELESGFEVPFGKSWHKKIVAA